MTTLLSTLVQTNSNFHPSVQLDEDYSNKERNAACIQNYIPTQETVEIFTEIAKSLQTNSIDRARIIVGTYGTGKSDLLLMLANYLSREVDDPVMEPFYTKLSNLSDSAAKVIANARRNRPSYLVIVLQADMAVSFPGFVLYELTQALERIGRADLMNPTAYAAAADRLDEWRQKGSERYNAFSQALQQMTGQTVEGLQKDLRSTGADSALRTFERVYQHIQDAPFEGKVSYKKPHQTFREVAHKLREIGNFSGIVLLCDEFTEFLKKLERSIIEDSLETESETKSIDNMAETSSRSGQDQLHFIVTSHRSFAMAADSSTNTQVRQALERSGARFKQRSLKSEYSEELVSGAIIRKTEIEIAKLLPTRQRDRLIQLSNELWGKRPANPRPRTWIERHVVDGAFPLHPLTTYCLPLLNSTLAQKERTMFMFLGDTQAGLAHFIETTSLESVYPNWSNLLTVDYLYDYFAESIQVSRTEVASGFAKAWQLVAQAPIDTALAERVLKALAVFELVTDPNVRATKERLRDALNLPAEAATDFDMALRLLEQHNTVITPNDTINGDYKLATLPGRVSFDALKRSINQRAQSLNISVADLPELPRTPIEAESYNQQRSSYRQLETFYVDGAALRNPASIRKDIDAARKNGNGVLWYVLASTADERLDAVSEARRLTGEYKQLVIAVPREPVTILTHIRLKRAVEGLRRNNDITNDEREFLRDDGQIGKQYITPFQEARKVLQSVRNWEWFSNGNDHTNVTTDAHVQEIASEVMKRLYSKTPRHNLAKQIKPDKLTPSLKFAVETIIKGDIKINPTSTSQNDAVMLKVVQPLGLIAPVKKENSYQLYRLAEPMPPLLDSRDIWQELCKLQEGISWHDVITLLRDIPYGLYESLLTLYVTAFLTFYSQEIEIRRKGIPTDLSLSLALMIGKQSVIESPELYSVRLQRLSDVEKKWLRAIVERGLREIFAPVPGKTYVAAVADQFSSWCKKLQLPLFALQLSSDEIATFFPGLTSEQCGIVKVLLNLSASSSQQIQGALFDGLPPILGVATPRDSWTDQDIETLMSQLEIAFDSIGELNTKIIERLAYQVAALFGGDTSNVTTKNAWSQAYNWRLVRNQVRPDDLKSDARALYRELTSLNGGFETIFLERLPRTMGAIGREYQYWPNITVCDSYIKQLELAVAEIEARMPAATPERKSQQSSDSEQTESPTLGQNKADDTKPGGLDIKPDTKEESAPVGDSVNGTGTTHPSGETASDDEELGDHEEAKDVVLETVIISEDVPANLSERAKAFIPLVRKFLSSLSPGERQTIIDLLLKEYGQ